MPCGDLQKLAVNYGPFVIIQYVCEINEDMKQNKIVKRQKIYKINKRTINTMRI